MFMYIDSEYLMQSVVCWTVSTWNVWIRNAIYLIFIITRRGRLFSIIALEFSLCKILSRKRGKFNSYPQKTILFWLAWANKHWHTLDSYIHSHLLTNHMNYSHEGWKQHLLWPFRSLELTIQLWQGRKAMKNIRWCL